MSCHNGSIARWVFEGSTHSGENVPFVEPLRTFLVPLGYCTATTRPLGPRAYCPLSTLAHYTIELRLR